MKAFVRLAVLLLWVPALLLAQTPTTPNAAAQATDNKPSASQPAAGTANPVQPANAAAPASAAKTTPASTEAAKPRMPGPYPVLSDKAKQRAREIYEYFAHGQTGLLYSSFAPEMKKQSPEAKVATISKQVTQRFGTPGDTLGENFLPGMGSPITLYSRTTLYSKPITEGPRKGQVMKVPLMVICGIDEKGQLTDFQVQPVPPTPRDEYTDYQDVTKLHLPFSGEWIVLQGGRALYDNANAAADDSRYTTSFMFLKDGLAFENDGRKNTDYYCFGQPVLAPAAGTVAQLSSSAQDHAPGRPSDTMSRGNYVVIAHGNSEYSLMPYLKSASVKVRIGQRVKQGDVVGECGNSGSSPFPHVEYSLQNTKGFPLPKTMPAQFVDYVADGKPVTIGEPLRGQMVSSQKTTPMETAGKP